jgi:hypothetical protein
MPEDAAFGSYFGDFMEDRMVQPTLLGSVPGATPSFLRAGELQKPGRARSQKFAPSFSRLRSLFSAEPDESEEFLETQEAKHDPLVELATLIEPDGGMPGKTLAERALRTLLTLLCFQTEERISQRGTFKKHLAKMQAFMQGIDLERIPDVYRRGLELGLQFTANPDFSWGEWLDVAERLAQDRKMDERQLEPLLDAVLDSQAISGRGV